MATLSERLEYGLSCHSSFYENRIVVLVKLTDSAFRALEEINRSPRNGQKPTVEFLGNEGRLCIPSADSNRGHVGFSFSLSNNVDIEGPQGSFECIQQHATVRTMDSYGPLEYKMRVQAKEDVYETTRHRMAVAEENQKKSCAREIKPNGPGINRKVKVKNSERGSSVLPSKKECDNLKNYNSVHTPLTNGFSHSPKSQINSAKSSQRANCNNSDISRRPIRERVIHLLALRPFKKPELVDRILKEGCKEKDKGAIMLALNSVASMRDNTYHLQRYIWNDVQEDWPFYTEQEKQTLKRHKPQNLTPPGSSDSGSSASGHSPPHANSRSSEKRPGYSDGTDGFPTKKQRISHYRRPPKPDDTGGQNDADKKIVKKERSVSPEEPSSRIEENHKRWNGVKVDEHDDIWNNSSADHNSTWNGSKPENHKLWNGVKQEDHKRNGEKQDDHKWNGEKQDGHKWNGVKQDDRKWNGVKEDDHKWNGVKDEDHSLWNGDKAESTTQDDSPENTESSYPSYLTTYTTITNSEQRARYKADFNANYTEYRELHAAVEKVSKRFAELEERLRQETEGSPSYQSIKSQILREYREKKKDKVHEENTRRFTYLHEKLSHIKRLVLEYDTAQHY